MYCIPCLRQTVTAVMGDGPALVVAVVNAKPGTGKTTSAVWLAHAFAERGPVLLIDADPSASALEWSDLALENGARFSFRVAGLASRSLDDKLPGLTRPGEVVIIDAPQYEDREAIARAAIRAASEVVIPCAPTPIEVSRTTPVRAELAELDPAPPRSCVLLNRCIARAHSVADARAALTSLGYDVLTAQVPRREIYAQSFGGPLDPAGLGIWRDVADELVKRNGEMT